jgi:hypothetical protein
MLKTTNLRLREFIPLRIGDRFHMPEEIEIFVENANIIKFKNNLFIRSVIFRIRCPISLPIIRPEYRDEDMSSWCRLSNNNKNDGALGRKAVRRFFHKERGRNAVIIGDYIVTVYPFFQDRESMIEQGYVCQVKIRKS